ncbi:MAG: DUF501 domain-containing protein [Acidimicrobiales bacterium]
MSRNNASNANISNASASTADASRALSTTEEATREEIALMLGREPRGEARVVVRFRVSGTPVVLENFPLFYDGTPMPTLFWLVDTDLVRQVSHLEAAGAITRIRASVDRNQLEESHRSYAALRDSFVPADYDGPRPSGGVGGTRKGAKCLHAHFAWYLAGAEDPVGRLVAEMLGISRSEFVVSSPLECFAVMSAANQSGLDQSGPGQQ